MSFVDVLGWIGMVLILGAYFAVSFEKIKSTSVWYQVANLVGAVAIGINTYFYMAYPSTVVNVVWAIIAAAASWKIWRDIARKFD